MGVIKMYSAASKLPVSNAAFHLLRVRPNFGAGGDDSSQTDVVTVKRSDKRTLFQNTVFRAKKTLKFTTIGLTAIHQCFMANPTKICVIIFMPQVINVSIVPGYHC